MLYGVDGKEISTTPLDPVTEAGRRNWSDITYLHECYQNFAAALQVGASKDYQYKDNLAYVLAGSPVWSSSDSFGDWCRDQEEHLVWRLQSLEEKKLQNRPSDSILLSVMDKVQDPDPYLGKHMTSEDYEIYEWVLRKSQEALRLFKQGSYTIDQVLTHEG